jgi:hypothetical protein
MPDEDRKYTDEQMALILRRAGDLQEQREDGRHTLAEIQEIARQVGVDPKLVAHVAADLPKQSPSVLTESATEVQTIETSLSQRVTPDQMGRLVDAVRRASGAQGTSRQVFDSVEWRAGSEHELLDLRVTITPGAERTNVRVQHDASGATFLGLMIGGAGALIGTGAAFSSLPLIAGSLVTAGIVGTAGAGLYAFRRLLARRGAAIVERVSRAVHEETAAEP